MKDDYPVRHVAQTIADHLNVKLTPATGNEMDIISIATRLDAGPQFKMYAVARGGVLAETTLIAGSAELPFIYYNGGISELTRRPVEALVARLPSRRQITITSGVPEYCTHLHYSEIKAERCADLDTVIRSLL